MEADRPKSASASYLFAILTALLCGTAKFDHDWLGFPDGHLTEWDQAYSQVLVVYGTLSALFTLGFVATGWLNRRDGMWTLVVAVILLSMACAGWMHWGMAGLESGQGG